MPKKVRKDKGITHSISRTTGHGVSMGTTTIAGGRSVSSGWSRSVSRTEGFAEQVPDPPRKNPKGKKKSS
jgi:hypothetical protein